jgi:hypothetical protein
MGACCSAEKNENEVNIVKGGSGRGDAQKLLEQGA